MAMRTSTKIKRLRARAFELPEAWEDHPWGESVAKVGKKVFVFLGREGHPDDYSFSVKLPESGEAARDLPFVSPTGYGLGKSGWVSVRLAEAGDFPLEELLSWIVESYRAVAPKKLVKLLGED
jgi:predicted DNA-binding protein (MmcQ/YjbR family)